MSVYNQSRKLKFTPTLLNFGLPMGLLGLGVNGEHLTYLTGFDYDFGLPFVLLGWFSFAYLILHYFLGLLNGNERVIIRNEWFNPFKRSFMPAVSLTALLFIQTLALFFPQATPYLLSATYIVVGLHIYINLFLLSGWIFDQTVTLNDHVPTWFILISANFICAITLMGLAPASSVAYEFSVFFVGVGLFLWLVFATSMIYRLIFHTPLDISIRPSLFIFLAPPSLACVASMLISDSYIDFGQVDTFSVQAISWMGYSFASIIFLVWLKNIKYFFVSGLSLSGWSYIYPMAAYGLATQYMAKALQSYFLLFVSLVLFAVIVIMVALLLKWHFTKVIHQAKNNA